METFSIERDHELGLAVGFNLALGQFHGESVAVNLHTVHGERCLTGIAYGYRLLNLATVLLQLRSEVDSIGLHYECGSLRHLLGCALWQLRQQNG